MKQRVIWGAIALLILLPFLLSGGLSFQVFAGLLAMIGVA
ncbi:phosphatidate cytidylyltransferase, partial [Enterococcus faecalis]|nr:phosphatidate cytidylyltransferase [Enterococcus faecalis]